MKQVTIENVKARIAQLETSEQIGGRLPIRHEFEMACLRQLVASMDKISESQREFRAADATIENLKMQVEKLAAENAWLKKFCKDAAFDADYEAELGMERGGFSDALNEIKTPATDAFLAEVRASELDSLAGVAETMLVKFANQCVSDTPESKGWGIILRQASQRAAMLRGAEQSPDTDNTAQQFEALATIAQREPIAVVKHYTGNTYPTLKFAQDEWCVCGDREDVQELADAINALATSAGSGKP